MGSENFKIMCSFKFNVRFSKYTQDLRETPSPTDHHIWGGLYRHATIHG